MFKHLLPVAVCLILTACAGTAGVVTPQCPHCTHHCQHRCEHGEGCTCDVGKTHDAQQADKPCEICMKSESASTVR